MKVPAKLPLVAVLVVVVALLGCRTASAFVASDNHHHPLARIQEKPQQHPTSPSISNNFHLLLAGPEIIDPSYNLAIGSFGIGLVGGALEDTRSKDGVKLATAKFFGSVALVFTAFAAFLTFQTTTLRFTFDDDAFSLVKNNAELTSFDNIKVGGENRWSYSSFQNWDFLPSQDFPILVYFKETQTPEENREDVPIVIDDKIGQVHFFPAIANTQEMEAAFRSHNCNKVK